MLSFVVFELCKGPVLINIDFFLFKKKKKLFKMEAILIQTTLINLLHNLKKN